MSWLKPKTHQPRKGMPSPRLDEAEFKRRFRLQYTDPVFGPLDNELAKITDAAWDACKNSRKSPHTQKAGAAFADPDYDLSVDWIAAHEAIAEAQRQHDLAGGPYRVLLINGSARSEHTCSRIVSASSAFGAVTVLKPASAKKFSSNNATAGSSSTTSMVKHFSIRPPFAAAFLSLGGSPQL